MSLIGCELGCADIYKGILEKMDASTQLIVLVSSAVARNNAKGFSNMIEEFLKTESNCEARISNARDCSAFRQFDMEFKLSVGDEVEGDLLICEQCGKCKMSGLLNIELSSEIVLYRFENNRIGSRFQNGLTMGVVTKKKCARMIWNGTSRTLLVNKECPLYMEHMISRINR